MTFNKSKTFQQRTSFYFYGVLVNKHKRVSCIPYGIKSRACVQFELKHRWGRISLTRQWVKFNAIHRLYVARISFTDEETKWHTKPHDFLPYVNKLIKKKRSIIIILGEIIFLFKHINQSLIVNQSILPHIWPNINQTSPSFSSLLHLYLHMVV